MNDARTLADYPVATTSLIPTASTSSIIFGNFSDVLLGVWSELDLLINPFSETQYLKGSVLIRAMASLDINLRHTESFAYCDDAPVDGGLNMSASPPAVGR